MWSKKRKVRPRRPTRTPRKDEDREWVVEVWCPKAEPTTGFIEVQSTIDHTIKKFRTKEDFGKRRLPDGTWVFGWKPRWCYVLDIEKAGDGLAVFNRLVAISTTVERRRNYQSACELAKEVEKTGKLARIRLYGTDNFIPAAIL